ncbi:hypothetical protein QBC37DRAFT_146969 [Rhypophila decipiens]|uniref:Uncharacterized protein n=1 Tax=Rhypophila decipiens TaxID=261697 RepID=A0AAN6Y9E3_9PEZI|nr:hypothetical protein QBC37DRAFT_146969 [Rhypophila decipiens]
MDRFNFFSRNNRENTTAEPSIASRREERREEYDDESPLSPRVMPDIEAQRGVPEMVERPAPHASFLPRFRPAIPSWFSVASSRRQQDQVRPSSSHYSGDGLPPDTVVNGGGLESPKTPLFRIRPQDLPSTRLHLPNLTRTWTQGSNGPPTRPGTSRAGPDMADEIAVPTPAVTAAMRQVSAGTETGRERRHHRRGGSDGSRRSRRHRSNRSRDETDNSARRDDDSRSSRRQRRRDRERARENGHLDEQEQQSRERHRRHRRREREGERARRPPPKHFLFCFPWIKSRRMRTQVLRCFVSGILLAMLLTIYLVLSITKNINNSEFTVLLILIILFITIFFCHSLIRICMMVVKGGRNPEETEDSRETTQLPHFSGPGGYAIPREPIRVVLARDEEAVGIESETTKIQPPAYGLWRESVRVDPNRIYWQRNEEASSPTPEEESSASSSTDSSSSSSSNSSESSRGGQRTDTHRPPSYISEDGVNYVIEAQPRSIAPTTEVPLRSSMHPSELGRAAPPAGW